MATVGLAMKFGIDLGCSLSSGFRAGLHPAVMLGSVFHAVTNNNARPIMILSRGETYLRK